MKGELKKGNVPGEGEKKKTPVEAVETSPSLFLNPA